jgi:uncharacterized protein
MSFVKHDVKVIVGGTDVTSRFRPRLLELKVDRAAGKASDSASIKVANPNGEIRLPQDRAPITIHIDGVWVFEGFVSEVTCSIDKSAGRTLDITASSVDHGGQAKEPKLRHKDDASFQSVASEFGSKAGLSVQVLGSVASVQRKYWIQQSESFISWGQRQARELGATFKVIGSRAFFAARNEGLSASGRPLTPIAATFGVNLLSASIRPIVSRPRFKQVKISYFDIAKGEKVEEEIDTGIGGVDAALRHVISAATKDHAKNRADALGKESDREKGQGDVDILGDPRAEPEAICTVTGVAPGADGSYRIDSVSHSVSKSGFTTSLSLRQPQDGTGSDSR